MLEMHYAVCRWQNNEDIARSHIHIFWQAHTFAMLNYTHEARRTRRTFAHITTATLRHAKAVLYFSLCHSNSFGNYFLSICRRAAIEGEIIVGRGYRLAIIMAIWQNHSMLLLSSFYLVNVEMSHFLSRDQIKLTACYAANTLQAHNPFLPRNREPSNILANSPLSAMHIEEKCFIILCCGHTYCS